MCGQPFEDEEVEEDEELCPCQALGAPPVIWE